MKSKTREAGQLSTRKNRLTRARQLADILRNQLAVIHAEYMELSNRCKQLDRSFIKTFQGLGAQFQAVQDVYRYGSSHNIITVTNPQTL